jgi:hypothetical protein
MNLRCLFHVSPIANAQPKPQRQRMPSVVDADSAPNEPPRPRGRSVETWSRARGWGSED